MIRAALASVLSCGHLPASLGDSVTFVGGDPVFPTPYRIGTAGAASLAAVGLAMASLRARQTGTRPGIEIDVRAATASLRSSRCVKIDGKEREPSDALTGFYPVANGRWIYFHCNLRPHREAVLRVLGVPAERERVTDAALRRDGFELEQAVDAAGGCAPVVRTPEE